jgi:hypothetical protein
VIFFDRLRCAALSIAGPQPPGPRLLFVQFQFLLTPNLISLRFRCRCAEHLIQQHGCKRILAVTSETEGGD